MQECRRAVRAGGKPTRTACVTYLTSLATPDMIRSRLHRLVVARRRRSGFTLIEILVVIVVIAILATLVAPNIFQNVGAAKSATAKSQIEMLGAALDAYRLDNGSYPTTQQGLPRTVGRNHPSIRR